MTCFHHDDLEDPGKRHFYFHSNNVDRLRSFGYDWLLSVKPPMAVNQPYQPSRIAKTPKLNSLRIMLPDIS